MKILLGVGGSERSRRALEDTVERVQETGEALAVAIFDAEDVDATATEVESDVRETLESAGVEAEIHRLSGHPAGELVGLADEGDFDRLVIGGGTRSPLGKIQLGSIAEFVILNAETPVTLIR
ncbi:MULTISPECIES: universal stress protein [unclassified Halorhabdus]|uniref:universal stress protein n=1 Tax=unclassified Halorhabdus TaxID=2621901 RepID=UPI0023DB4858|nr:MULTISPECIES: universal stress protein [unclassified Halorhabdus]WEL16833.1 Nucleotide-binding protein, UspA family [Halorhabdus sp. SVX81]WEL20707.1 Nucleotide-binding protein, UspA family [Halorhabdus sp. BNX81]